jgi:hypothetical protein
MIYKGQTLLIIELDTNYDLTGATNPKILYKKPDAAVGFWPGTITGSVISYQLQEGTIDQSGVWSFQAYFEKSGKKGYSEKVRIEFLQPNE